MITGSSLPMEPRAPEHRSYQGFGSHAWATVGRIRRYRRAYRGDTQIMLLLGYRVELVAKCRDGCGLQKDLPMRLAAGLVQILHVGPRFGVAASFFKKCKNSADRCDPALISLKQQMYSALLFWPFPWLMHNFETQRSRSCRLVRSSLCSLRLCVLLNAQCAARPSSMCDPRALFVPVR